MIRRPTRSTRTVTLFPSTTLFVSFGNVILGFAGVELVLVGDADDDFIDERRAKARDLRIGAAGNGRPLGRSGRDRALRAPIQHARLRPTRPPPGDAHRNAALGQAAGRPDKRGVGKSGARTCTYGGDPVPHKKNKT